jgi:hypothetical protein
VSSQLSDAITRLFQTVPSRRRVLGGSIAVAVALGLAAGVEEATAGNVKKRLKKRERREDALQLERNNNIASALGSMEGDIGRLNALGDSLSSVTGAEDLAASIKLIAWDIESKRALALEWLW